MARGLLSSPDVLILDEPICGADVGARCEIYAIIADLAERGWSIIMVSSEPPAMGRSSRKERSR
ncbi:hypothetical protein WME90_15915 [Sorangium sp. So ce375]|uniref:hypothetical protein n=1 Tax=Sorangium sp. So ce375 TaxID=3133306 RepID=UPI003F5BF0CB